MRTISAGGLAKLTQTHGTEPVIILEIQWTDGGSIYRYADIDIEAEGVRGVIMEVGGLDNVITVSGVSSGTTGESQQLSFTLSDHEGTIKEILDTNDVHKRPAWVYQWYKGLAFSDRFLLFKGQVSSPIEWHEGDRTIRLDVINQIEDAEVGFSIEEGNFSFLPEDLIGKPWPLVFGTCIHVPALKIRSPYKGTLRTGFGVHDFTKEAKLDQLQHMCCPLVFRGFYVTSQIGGQEARPIFAQEPGCYCQRQATLAELESELALERSYEFSTIEIIGGDIFPQGQTITLDICGARVTGKFTGTIDNPTTTFNVQGYVHPEFATTTVPPTINFLGCEVRSLASYAEQYNTQGGTFASRDQVLFAPIVCGEEDNDTTNLGWDYFATFPTADFFWAEPGCEVFFVGDEEIVYVVNLLPSTILRVAAFRTYDSGVRELVTVPQSYYTTRLSDFNGYTVTEIVMTRPLSRRAEGWEDDIYVSQTSSVGPNTVDIIEWLITKYTSFVVDSTSFNDVRTKIDNYPSNFPLLERRNIIEVLKDIAFQARCALYLRNDTFFIRYLSEEPDTNITITEDDVLPNSLIIGHTETEELVTKFVARWIYDHSKDEPNTAIYRYNVKKYGTQEREFNFFIYNILELVTKSATFWLIRMANTWRRLKLKTPLNKLQAEVFDVAEVTLDDFANGPIKCLIEQASYDSETHEISFDMWTPVRSGERETYDFAWPAYIDITLLYPTEDDLTNGIAGGTGPNVDVSPPASHPLAQPTGFNANFKNYPGDCSSLTMVSQIAAQNCRPDHGDKKPSDLDDQKPAVKVPGQGESSVPATKNPVGVIANPFVKDLIQKNAEQQANSVGNTNRTEMANDSNSNPGGSETDPMDSLPETPPEGEECVSCVTFYQFDDVDSVYQPGTELSLIDPGDVGKARTGNPPFIGNMKSTTACYNSRPLAIAQANRWSEIGIHSYNATVGQPWPVIAVINFLAAPGCNDITEEDGAMISWERSGNDTADQMFKDILNTPDSDFVDTNGDPLTF